MKIYTKYCNNYPAAEKLYKDKIKKKEFEAFVHVSITSTPMNKLLYHFLYGFNNTFSFLTVLYIWQGCYEHQVCQAGLNLPAYLISVVQRIPRYLLLLQVGVCNFVLCN